VAGRLANPALPSGAPVVNVNAAPAAVPVSQAHAPNAAKKVSGRNIVFLRMSVDKPTSSYSMRFENSREVDYRRSLNTTG
jgi:hypothetical protein